MSDFREIRFWGEDNSVKGGEFRDSDNNCVRIYTITESHPGYASLLSALAPAANVLQVTAGELFDAIKLLEPIPEGDLIEIDMEDFEEV